MKKIPVELLTTLSSAAHHSPVLWDGVDIIVSPDASLNLLTLSNHVARLISTSSSQESQITNLRQELNEVAPTTNMLKTTFPAIQTRMAGIELLLKDYRVQVTTLETRMADVETNISKLKGALGVSPTSVTNVSGLSVVPVQAQALAAPTQPLQFKSGNQIVVTEEQGAYCIDYVGQDMELSSASDLLQVTATTPKQYTIDFNLAALKTKVTAGKGLAVDPTRDDACVLIPNKNLVRGDDATIAVSYDANAGEFTVRSIQESSTYLRERTLPDNKTIVKTDGVITVSPDYLYANVHQFNYVSQGFYQPETVTASCFSRLTVAECMRVLPSDLSDLAAAKEHGAQLAPLMSESATIYALRDANNEQKTTTYVLKAQTLNKASVEKTCCIEFAFSLRTLSPNQMNYLLRANVVTPFVIYWLYNPAKGQNTYSHVEILRYGLSANDGREWLYQAHHKKILTSTETQVQGLNHGILQPMLLLGFLVQDPTTFEDTVFTQYMLAPKFTLTVTYF